MLPAAPQLYLAGRDGEALLTTAGTLRARIEGDRVTLGALGTLTPIVSAAADGERWWFLTHDGGLFSSQGFLGSLTRVASSGGQALEYWFPSTGIAVARNALDGVAWLGGEGGLRRVPAPLDAPLLDGTFADGRFGAFAVAPGVLYRTADGGQTFERVDLGAAAVRWVDQDPGDRRRLLLSTTEGRLELGASGPPRVVRESDFPDVSDRLPQDARTALVRAFDRRSVPADTRLLADGAMARLEGERLLLTDPSGAERSIELPSGTCDAVWHWGARPMVDCHRQHSVELLALDPDGSWSSVRTMRFGPSILWASVDGSTLALNNPCDDDDYNARAGVCVRSGSGWRTQRLSADSQMIDLYGEWILYETVTLDGDAHLVNVRLSRIGDRDEGRALTLSDRDAVVRFALFTPEGLVAGLASRGEERFALVGRPDETLQLRPAPRDAVEVAFASATRGIAVGRDLSKVWVTTDGAVSWQPLSLPVDGDAASVRLVNDRRRYERFRQPSVACTRWACMLGNRAVWYAPDAAFAAHLEEPTALAAQQAPPPQPPDPEEFNNSQWGYWTCNVTVDGSAQVRWAREAPGRVFGPDGWLDAVPPAAATAAAPRFALRWTAMDAQGRFSLASRAAPVPPVELPGTGPLASQTLRPVVFTRALAVVERCATRDDETRCDLLVARPGQPIARLDATRTLLQSLYVTNKVRQALGLADGGAALLLGSDEDLRGEVLLRLSPDGAVAGTRGYSWPSNFHLTRYLAVSPQGPGVAVANARAPRVFTFHGMNPQEAPRRLGELPTGRLRACNGPIQGTLIQGGSWQYRTTLSLSAPGRSLYNATSGTRTVFELDGQGACLRAFAATDGGYSSTQQRDDLIALGGVLSLRASGGGVTGALLGPTATAPITCTQDNP